jgi:hypothetical protein
MGLTGPRGCEAGLAVRIAVSGTHVIGKSTLAEALGERLRDHTIVPEPYELLADRGYEFEHPPSVEDFVAQLRQSLAVLRRPAPNLIFDRCPLDFLGYIYASPGVERFDVEPWRRSIAAAMASLDLVVAPRVDPQHEPRVLVEDAAFRLAVDGWLRDIVEGDELDLCESVDILVLGGAWDRRVETVLAHVKTMRNERPGAPRR